MITSRMRAALAGVSALAFAGTLMMPAITRAADADAHAADADKRDADVNRRAPEADRAADADGDWRPDAWITAKTKIALATDDQVEAGDVNVDTVDGRITLHGKVQSDAAKKQAETIARGIDGATDVRNLLQVVAETKRDTVERKDEEIQAAVDQALENDPELRSSSIDVESVNNGVVLLGGSADTLLAHLEAIRTASSVDGVRRVETQAETGDELYDEKLWHDADKSRDKSVIDRAAGATRDAGRAIGDAGRATGDAVAGAAGAVGDSARNAAGKTADAGRDAGDSASNAAKSTSNAMSDAWITTSTKTRLLADPDTPALSINVDTEDGVVTLFGSVPSEQARAAAIEHAKAASGNSTVRDELTIDPTAAGDVPETRLSDDQLEENVRKQLEAKNKFDRADIDVDVKDGVAELSGTAPNSEIKMAAAMAARSVDGVRAVRNEIRVEPKS